MTGEPPAYTEHERKEDEELLVREIGDVGARSGALGGALGARLGGGASRFGAAGGRRGGRRGASFVAKRLGLDMGGATLEVAAPSASVGEAAAAFLDHGGELLGRHLDSSGGGRLRGMLGAGALNMNPAVIRVEVSSLSEHATRVRIRGMAKEGLIKQRAGQKAVARMRDRLAREFGPVVDAP